VPRWPGCRPFEPVPVQLSCRVERPAGLGGGYRHVEWLADGGTDPRPGLAAALVAACAGAATIVVDDLAAARAAVARLGEAVPGHAAALAALQPRLVQGAGPLDAGDGPEAWELHRLLFERELLDPQEVHLLRESRLAAAARRSWWLATGGRMARVV
jgi:hypothetical protein